MKMRTLAGIETRQGDHRGERDPKWVLEVVDDDRGSTVWDELFETDQAALDEFNRALEADGIRSMIVRLARMS